MKDYEPVIKPCEPPQGQTGAWHEYVMVYTPAGYECFTGQFKGSEKEVSEHAFEVLRRRKKSGSVLQPDKLNAKRVGIQLNQYPSPLCWDRK